MSYSFTERIPRESVESYPNAEKDIYAGMFEKMIKESDISSNQTNWGALEFEKYDPKFDNSRLSYEIANKKAYIGMFGIDMIEFNVSFSACDECGMSNI